MSGTIPLSMTQQFDVYGQPLAGGQLYIIQAATVATPQNPYQDAALSIVMPNPITLDAAGRVPQFFLADGYIKIRLTDTNGIVQLASDGILVIGPSAGGGGGGSVDPTTILATGDIKTRYDTSVITGFVRCNGRTLGNSSSGATELADTTQAQALFNYLWNKDSSLVVLPSRGATSAADYTASRTIALPDWRGYALAGLDDMGNTQANRLSIAFFGTSPIVLGAAGGTESKTLTQANLPSVTLPGSVAISDPGHTHPIVGSSGTGGGIAVVSGAGGTFGQDNHTGTATTGITATASTALGGSNSPHSIVSPRKLLTIYMKL